MRPCNQPLPELEAVDRAHCQPMADSRRPGAGCQGLQAPGTSTKVLSKAKLAAMGFVLWLVFLALTVIRPQDLQPGWAQYSIMQPLAALGVVATALSLAIGHRPRLAWTQLAAGLAFLLWSAFSVAAAVRWFGGAVQELGRLAVPFFTLLLLTANVTSRARLRLNALVLSMSVFLLLCMALRAYYANPAESQFFIRTAARGGFDTVIGGVEIGPVDDAGDSDDEGAPPATVERTTVKRIKGVGFLNDPNDFAQALLAVVPIICLAWSRGRPVFNLLVVILPVAVLSWGVLLTRSRGGVLALAALVPLAILQRLSAGKRRAATLVLLLAAVPGMVALLSYATSEASAESRIEAWAAGLLMLKSSPIWGVGSGLFTEHHTRVAHNSYIQCFAETGLVGYFLWLSLACLSLFQMWELARTSRREHWIAWARAAELSFVSFLISALFLSRTTSPLFFILSGQAVAVASAARLEGERVELPVSWPLQIGLLEVASILVVWLTMRARSFVA